MGVLSVAILGAGNIAGGFDQRRQIDDAGVYSHAGAYLAHGGFSINTIFDLNLDKAKDFCGYWNASKVALSFQQILSEYHDVVSVCTPDESHCEYLRALLLAGCCKTVLVEKPLADNLADIAEISEFATSKKIQIITNFQRRHESVHSELKKRIALNPDGLVSVAGHYMKGLQHVGVTMIDTICYLCGLPDAVMAYSRVFCRVSDNYSYEFILYYPNFTVSVKTTDADRFNYTYHIFELDFLFADGRVELVDISQGARESALTDYAYSGVRILNDKLSKYTDTGYSKSMLNVASYVYDVTTGMRMHDVNTPASSYNNAVIINRVIESFESGLKKLNFESNSWKN